MINKAEKKALINNLPDNWRELAAEKFGKSVSYIEKVGYGTKNDLIVFEHLVTLAEHHKMEVDSKMADLKSRLQKLSNTEEVL